MVREAPHQAPHQPILSTRGLCGAQAGEGGAQRKGRGREAADRAACVTSSPGSGPGCGRARCQEWDAEERLEMGVEEKGDSPK